jgi:two-component system sensor histidine kinase MtrB
VERILRNLLGNAIDHSEGNPVRVLLAENDDAVALAVRDYGVGLKEGQAELVFNRFWRADPSRNRRTGGTGLGLAISLEDARLHGGKLEAWGQTGNGAYFRLTLPKDQSPQPEIIIGAEEPAPLESPLPMPPVDAIDVDSSTVRIPSVEAEQESADLTDVSPVVEHDWSELEWQPAEEKTTDQEQS